MPARHGLRLLRALLAVPLLALAIVAAASTLAPVTDATAASTQASSNRSSERATTRQQKVLRAADVALRQIGDRYRYGAAGPRSFDCSGLMQYSYRKAGLTLPRTSSAQAKRAHRIKKKNLRRGDLMFFHDGGGVYHAAMFLKWKKGHAVMVHSPGSGERVRRDKPWTRSWFAATVRR